MGINLAQAVLLVDWIERYRLNGAVASLGVQHLDFSQNQLDLAAGRTIANGSRASDRDEVLTAEKLFRQFGFDSIFAIDFDLSEGADLQYDLNTSVLPEFLVDQFDLVVNGGTLEHVFHLPNALANLNRMLKPDGVIWHIMPCHNCVDHGFYQFGPTLVFDYYRTAGFEVLESAAVALPKGQNATGETFVFPVLEGQFGAGLIGALDSTPLLYMALVRKRAASTPNAMPTQRLYTKPEVIQFTPTRWFAPFKIRHGEKMKKTQVRKIEIDNFVPADGLAWHVELESLAEHSNNIENPVRSSIVVFEDNVPLGPAHVPHNEISKFGRGRYSHWDKWLVLSTKDGSDPRINGRSYVVAAVEGLIEQQASEYKPDGGKE